MTTAISLLSLTAFIVSAVALTIYCAEQITAGPDMFPPHADPDMRTLAEVLADHPERDLYQPPSLHEREALALADSAAIDADLMRLMDERDSMGGAA